MQAWRHAQSSSTNCPMAFSARCPSGLARRSPDECVRPCAPAQESGSASEGLFAASGVDDELVFCTVTDDSLIKAIDSVGDPPLPIPNREVKPDSADGTAKVCGRVGHRHFFKRELQAIEALSFLHTAAVKPPCHLGPLVLQRFVGE